MLSARLLNDIEYKIHDAGIDVQMVEDVQRIEVPANVSVSVGSTLSGGTPPLKPWEELGVRDHHPSGSYDVDEESYRIYVTIDVDALDTPRSAPSDFDLRFSTGGVPPVSSEESVYLSWTTRR